MGGHVEGGLDQRATARWARAEQARRDGRTCWTDRNWEGEMARSKTPRAALRALGTLATLMAFVVLLAAQAGPASSEDGASSASNFLTFKIPVQQPGCTGGGLNTQ